MRRMLFLLVVLLSLFLTAAAEEALPDFAEAWFAEQYAALVPAGTEAEQQRESCRPFALADGTETLALRLTVAGNLRFGRYVQYVRTALLDAGTGEEIGLERVFADVDALQEFLDAYVEERVLDELNTYLDANDLLPVPLDNVSFDALGVTIHYPSERFMYFSGHAGAVQLQWYELREHLAIDLPDQPLPLTAGGSMEELLARYGSLTDPDLVEGGSLYEFESPALRGTQVVADEDGQAVAARFSRFSLKGAEPGAAREDVLSLLGEPDNTLTIDGDAALHQRIKTGVCDRYPDFTLYYDEENLLYLAGISLK